MSDPLQIYLDGLQRLIKQLDGQNLRQGDTLQQQLRENVYEAKTFADTSELKHERSKIISNLNDLTRKALSISFNEYCELNTTLPDESKQQEFSDVFLISANKPPPGKPDGVHRLMQVGLAPSKTDHVQASEIFESYNNGIRHLREAMGKTHPDYLEVLTLQNLQENIERARQFGDTGVRRANRAEIIAQLNQIAKQVVGISFLELCGSELYDNSIDLSQLRKILEALRARLSELEEIFDKLGPHKFTKGSISFLQADLVDMIIGIDNTPDETAKDCIKDTKCVLNKLREACDCASISLDLLETIGKTQQYYRSLRKCQRRLASALQCW